jgi:hypothetical protein
MHVHSLEAEQQARNHLSACPPARWTDIIFKSDYNTFFELCSLKVKTKLLFTYESFSCQVEPVISAGNEGIAHHIILYGCQLEFDEDTFKGLGGECYGDIMGPTALCDIPIFAWAVGGTVSQHFSIDTSVLPRHHCSKLEM